jgi:diaminobutyrate-2-oxoglutarate transaminase
LYHDSLDAWKPGAHVGTFRANQLAMIAGTATVNFIRAEGLPAHAGEMGERMLTQLRRGCGELACVGDIRGRGLMIGIEIVEPGTASPDPDRSPARSNSGLARAIQSECLRNGLLIETGGRNGSVLRLLPPLIISRDEVDTIAGIFGHSVEECAHRSSA